MTKAEWEKLHHYSNQKNVCANCKNSTIVEKTPWDHILKCKKRMEAGAGENVKSLCSCDLWEAEEVLF